ncbi:hypothetical protein J6590_076388 [Homalodisca vitripennis]|nr:hypothetical protein J6590_076388 [Homalodisca vitripennis]
MYQLGVANEVADFQWKVLEISPVAKFGDNRRYLPFYLVNAVASKLLPECNSLPQGSCRHSCGTSHSLSSTATNLSNITFVDQFTNSNIGRGGRVFQWFRE